MIVTYCYFDTGPGQCQKIRCHKLNHPLWFARIYGGDLNHRVPLPQGLYGHFSSGLASPSLEHHYLWQLKAASSYEGGRSSIYYVWAPDREKSLVQ